MTAPTTETALDAIQVFANSANSVRVFERLTDGPTTSKALAEQTGASRSTVARILDKGESRGWIDSEGSRYELTATGRIMIEEFRAYKRTIEGVQHLGEAIAWLPKPALSLDFRHFRDADLITGSPSNPAEIFDHMAAMMRTASRKRSLVTTAVPRLTELVHDRAEAGELDSELVIQASWFDIHTPRPDQLPIWRARAQRGSVWVYDGVVPINLEVLDDSVALWLGEQREEELVVRGVLVTETPAVVSWAESLYEEFRAAADPLDPAMLPEN